MLKKFKQWFNTVRYENGWYVKPTMRIIFLNGQEVTVTPKTYALVLADAPKYNWMWWVTDGVLLSRYPLSAIQEVDVTNWDTIAIKYTQDPLNMLKHDWITLAEIERKISEKVFEKA